MKRTFSIFLLLLMLVLGAQPVLAMHFCEGNLYSVGILDHTMPQACCETMRDIKHNNNSSSNQDNMQVFELDVDCCDIQKVELSTDEYQHQDKQSIGHVQPLFKNISFTLNYIFNWVESDTTTIAIRQTFPPGGLEKQNIDLLTYICIYRI